MRKDKTWFTSDTHFGHANIIKYCNRPFKDVVEMDNVLISNWNKVIKPDDDVYHLGDFSLSKGLITPRTYRQKLNGRIHLIRGNHDRNIYQFKDCFEWIKDVAEIDIDGQRIVLMHYAMRVWNKSHHGVWHLYGHSHGTLPDDPNSLSFDAGVDCHAYSPISFSRVGEIMKSKTFKPVDHHGKE